MGAYLVWRTCSRKEEEGGCITSASASISGEVRPCSSANDEEEVAADRGGEDAGLELVLARLMLPAVGGNTRPRLHPVWVVFDFLATFSAFSSAFRLVLA